MDSRLAWLLCQCGPSTPDRISKHYDGGATQAQKPLSQFGGPRAFHELNLTTCPPESHPIPGWLFHASDFVLFLSMLERFFSLATAAVLACGMSAQTDTLWMVPGGVALGGDTLAALRFCAAPQFQASNETLDGSLTSVVVVNGD